MEYSIIVLIFTLFLYLAAKTNSKEAFKSGYMELKYTSAFIWLIALLFSILPVMLLFSLIQRGGTKTSGDTIGFTLLLSFFFSADLLALIILKKDRIYFGKDGIIKRRAFGKDIFVKWEEIINVSYSHILKQLVIKKASGEKIRINIALSGFKNFCEKIPPFIPDVEFKRQIYIASQSKIFS